MASPNLSTDFILPLDACVRSIAVNRNAPHIFFLGAGASVTSGVPTASACIWQWKRAIFLTQHAPLANQFSDLSLASVQVRIQRWLDEQGIFPSLGSPDEYGCYAEHCYPIAEDRRQYFQRLVERAKPYLGYQLLCLMAEAGIVKAIWTTNFDGLVGKAAAASHVTPVEIGLDSSHRTIRQPREGELLCVALHGDYRYDALKNTPDELRDQDARLRNGLVSHLRDSTLIVSGYSGRDESVMKALAEVYSQAGAGRLYWCGRDGDEVSEPVRCLIDTARTHHHIAHYVPTRGFDDLLTRLATHSLEGDSLARTQMLCSAMGRDPDLQPPPFAIRSGATSSVIRSNAFPIDCPVEVFQFDMEGIDQPGAWARLKDTIAGREIVAVLLRRKVLAIGQVSQIREAFGASLVGDVTRTPIEERELSHHDGVIVSLLTQSLVRSIALSTGLQTDGRSLVWKPEAQCQQSVYNMVCNVHDAALLRLQRHRGKQYLVVKPTIKGSAPDGADLPDEVEQELKRQLLTRQYNREFSHALSSWAKLLFGSVARTFEYPPESGSGFRFTVFPVPVLAQLSEPQGRAVGRVAPSVQRHIHFEGTVFSEPRLVFSNTQGDGFVRDVHPIRGIIRNQPYDYAFTKSGLGREVRLGVICPAQDAQSLSDFLHGLHQRCEADSKQEYLLEYPGFQMAFGLPLDIPRVNTGCWLSSSEPNQSLDVAAGARELARQITAGITALAAGGSPSVIAIYVPERWNRWERYCADGERFDLHDYVKAFGVERGITTQFIRASTLRKSYQCEILWWLALSLYVKAMRTPWLLDSLDQDTAFVGIGYSIDAAAERGQHVVLGCSHLFGSNGQSLSYRLSKLDNPTFRHRNPYMSREDARSAGETVRQLFFESMVRLPRRVVIHKRTPFFPDERRGLLEGLSGVACVDMLEISVDRAMRFAAARLKADGSVELDGFPVRRGTTIVLDHRRALVWVHGTTDAVVPPRRYYLGKSRIPAPLVLVRHHGNSDLSTLVREMLGLSKMNWNTFDMYTKEPATIASSSAIARIGSLLDRFGPMSYDYRLFI